MRWGESFEIGYIGWSDFQTWDPANFLSWMFDGRTIPPKPNCPGDHGDWSHFNSAKYNRLLDEASRLRGAARNRAFGDLDVQLSRDAAPAIPWAILNDIQFVSPRVGCVTFNPLFDLTAVCLK